MNNNAIDLRQWLAYSSIWVDIYHGGILCFAGNYWIAEGAWGIATIRCYSNNVKCNWYRSSWTMWCPWI